MENIFLQGSVVKESSINTYISSFVIQAKHIRRFVEVIPPAPISNLTAEGMPFFTECSESDAIISTEGALSLENDMLLEKSTCLSRGFDDNDDWRKFDFPRINCSNVKKKSALSKYKRITISAPLQ